MRDTAVQIGSDALRAQAEANLEKRAVDKAPVQCDDGGYPAPSSKHIHQCQLADEHRAAPHEQPWPRLDFAHGPTPENEREYERSVARARQLIPILATAAQRNLLISLAYVALEEAAWSRSITIIMDTLLSTRPFDAHQRPWYTAARDAGRTVWVDTYIDANTKKLVTTCSVPLYDLRDTFVGVVGFDLLLDTIQQDLQARYGPGRLRLSGEQGRQGAGAARHACEWAALE